MEIMYNKELSGAPNSSTTHSSPCIPPCGALAGTKRRATSLGDVDLGRVNGGGLKSKRCRCLLLILCCSSPKQPKDFHPPSSSFTNECLT